MFITRLPVRAAGAGAQSCFPGRARFGRLARRRRRRVRVPWCGNAERGVHAVQDGAHFPEGRAQGCGEGFSLRNGFAGCGDHLGVIIQFLLKSGELDRGDVVGDQCGGVRRESCLKPVPQERGFRNQRGVAQGTPATA